MASGNFSVSRKIWAHPEFKPAAFSEREAFLWLVSEASWKARTVRAGRVVVDLKRGQLCASLRFMADAWQWPKSNVDRFLKRLKKRDMIGTEGGTGQLVITLCNYDEYQPKPQSNGTDTGQKAGHERDTSGTNYNKDEIKGEGNRDTNVSLSLVAPKAKPPDLFSEFWERYPKRIGKAEAHKAYKRALKKITHDDLMFALSEQLPAIEAKEKKYQPNPATWLNQERWQDEIDTDHGRNGSGPSRSRNGMVDAFAAVAARRSASASRGGGNGGGFI